MGADVRRQVRDSARYLRSVRPIDPDELADYVEGGAHPAVVRQLLREEAFDLGLVERADGTFVPIPDGPLATDFDDREGVTALPAIYDRALEECLVEEFGPDWHRGESGRSLRGRLRRLKATYFHGDEVTYDVETALAYAVYHLADFYAATGYVLDELGRDGLLPRELRVLDVGAGAGGPALALHDYCLGPPGGGGAAAGGGGADDDGPETPPARVAYHALEPGAGADVLEELLGETGPNFQWTVTRERVEAFEPDDEPDDESEGEGQDDATAEGFDLVLFGNVLSELDEPTATVERALDWLAPDGTLVAMAPADLETATGLRSVERDLVRDGAATVYAPATWLWAGRHPTDRGWSFDRRPPVRTPRVQERLAEEAEDPAAVTNTAVKFAYSLLRTDGRRRHDVAIDRSHAVPLGDADEVVTERVNLVAAKLSRDLRGEREREHSGERGTDGARSERGNPIYKIGDGSEREECYAVLVRETVLNEALRTAGYGALVRLENALVLWNDDEGGYNVVVDEDAIVDLAGRGAAEYPAP